MSVRGAYAKSVASLFALAFWLGGCSYTQLAPGPPPPPSPDPTTLWFDPDVVWLTFATTSGGWGEGVHTRTFEVALDGAFVHCREFRNSEGERSGSCEPRGWLIDWQSKQIAEALASIEVEGGKTYGTPPTMWPNTSRFLTYRNDPTQPLKRIGLWPYGVRSELTAAFDDIANALRDENPSQR